MNLSIKSTIAAAVLSLASAAALAAPPIVPVQPVAGPVPVTGSGNGGLVFYGYDTVAQTSLTLWLGLNLDSVLPADMTADLNFGVLSGWNTAFGSSTAGNVNWFIAAGDATPNTGNFSGNRLAVTAATDPTGNLRNSALRAATGEMNSFIATRINVGSNANPSLADAITDSNWMYHGTQINDFAGAARVNFVTTTAHSSTGSELPFWFTQGNNSTNGLLQASVTGYEGIWKLAGNGALTYDVVEAPIPLPAAAWLLLSGLAGLGAVARRRGQAAA